MSGTIAYDGTHGDAWAIAGAECPWCGATLDALVPDGDTLYCECGHEAVIDATIVDAWPDVDGPAMMLGWITSTGPVVRYLEHVGTDR